MSPADGNDKLRHLRVSAWLLSRRNSGNSQEPAASRGTEPAAGAAARGASRSGAQPSRGFPRFSTLETFTVSERSPQEHCRALCRLGLYLSLGFSPGQGSRRCLLDLSHPNLQIFRIRNVTGYTKKSSEESYSFFLISFFYLDVKDSRLKLRSTSALLSARRHPAAGQRTRSSTAKADSLTGPALAPPNAGEESSQALIKLIRAQWDAIYRGLMTNPAGQSGVIIAGLGLCLILSRCFSS